MVYMIDVIKLIMMFSTSNYLFKGNFYLNPTFLHNNFFKIPIFIIDFRLI